MPTSSQRTGKDNTNNINNIRKNKMKTINYKILIETKASEEEFQTEILDYDLEYTFYDRKETQGFNQIMIETENKNELEKFISQEFYPNKLIEEIQEEEIDWKQRSKDLELALDSLLKTCKERRKEIRDLKKKLRDLTIKTYVTDCYTISIFDEFRGSFEHNQLGEDDGGSLEFDGLGNLIDYDGVYQLSSEVIASLEENGFTIHRSFK